MRTWMSLFLSCFVSVSVAATAASPVGYWKTVDDVTGRVRSIVKIDETPKHQLTGTIVKTFPTPGKEPLKVCSACEDERHNHPIIGLVIMSKLTASDDLTEWGNGEILDPTNGKIYKCKIKLIDNNEKLQVRGYIGLPLLGRSQTWLRTTSE